MAIQIISPGSQTTLAQLGLPESFTPARLRISTRMFPAEKRGEWEPMKVREKRIAKTVSKNGPAENGSTDAKMIDVVDGEVNGADQHLEEEEEILYEEDPTSDEGAENPLVEGRIVNWPCFFALLTHVYNTLSPPFHTPILVISQPCWTARDHEILTQFFFEKFQAPAFCLMDSALAVSYAYATGTATVVDVGYGKCDITTITEHIISELGRAAAIPGCGGEAMTQRLLSLMSAKGFNRDMCEQLKKNPICEVLPPGSELPTDVGPEEAAINPASAASTGATNSGDGRGGSIAAQGGAPRGPGVSTEAGDADQERELKDGEDEDGVLDVASIVASGKTSEFLAKKEREKADKATAKKNAAAEAAAAKQAKLPNSKRARATFSFLERRSTGEPEKDVPKPAGDGTHTTAEAAAAARKEERKEERRRNREGAAYVRKEIEVGLDRFEAASGGVLDRIADSIHRCILSVPEVNRRSELWDSIIVVGNGSKIKGFKEALLATLHSRYLISPNSATIFTSELPSNFSTPVATGANTPQPQLHHPSHHPSGVNPLLHAATTASLAPPGQSHQQSQMQQYQQQQFQLPHSHSSHAQTPTSIKVLRAPEYFPEWKEVGMEEASFLGAQVAAKVVFVVDQGVSKGFMSRTEYNELGPSGIHESCL